MTKWTIETVEGPLISVTVPFNPEKTEYKASAIVNNITIPTMQEMLFVLALESPSLAVTFRIFSQQMTRDQIYTTYVKPFQQMVGKRVRISNAGEPYDGNDWILASVNTIEYHPVFFDVNVEFKRGSVVISVVGG